MHVLEQEFFNQYESFVIDSSNQKGGIERFGVCYKFVFGSCVWLNHRRGILLNGADGESRLLVENITRFSVKKIARWIDALVIENDVYSLTILCLKTISVA